MSFGRPSFSFEAIIHLLASVPRGQCVERGGEAVGIVEIPARHHVQVERDRRVALKPRRRGADDAELDLVLDQGAEKSLWIELGHPCPAAS